MCGTPETLREAIENALKEGQDPARIEVHIRDYLAQKFSVAFFDNRANETCIEELWYRITGKRIIAPGEKAV